MNRLVVFDYIRGMSILGIVLCHCCYGINGMSFLGHFLGSTFNIVFLILSAFLLGLAWKKKQCKTYDVTFLKHRIGKLAYTYYPFLVFMFVFLTFTGYHIGIEDCLMHIFFLPWFDKLPGFGHLWFVTMIVFCYIGVYVISKVSINMLTIVKSGGVILAVFSQFILGMISLPNYVCIYLILYLLVFLNAREILEWSNKIHIIPMLIVCCVVLPIIVSSFYYGFINKYTSVYCGIISAILVFSVLNRLLNKAKGNKIISFISSISFEIYLVHHVFCFGRFSLFEIVENPIIGILIIFSISILLAYFLHLISTQISTCFINNQN